MFHKLTKNISVEHVHFPPPHLQVQLNPFSAKGPASDVITQKEKENFDDFDKLLGFRTKNPNPIVRITSSFLGPLMRIVRIVIYITRISFNVSTWRDPYLTFWFFAFFCILTFILLIFPWRTFFLVSTVVFLGPQVRHTLICRIFCRFLVLELTWVSTLITVEPFGSTVIGKEGKR